jgi:F0F1-type ATP synthase assembly protein I
MPSDHGKNLNSYARYSGMAFQMLAIILAGVFAGFKLDGWLNTKPVLTVVLSILAVVLSIYFATRDLLKKE